MIKEKKCNECNEIKLFSEFNKKVTGKYGLQSTCKECDSKKSKERYRTKGGLITQIYSSQKKGSLKRGHKFPTYTKQELKDWLYTQKEFHELFDNWKAYNYEKKLVPSCDRIDDYKGYSLDNIQLMTWKDNSNKGCSDRKNGINNKGSKAVIKCDIEGNFIKEYYSAMNAERETNTDHSSISKCCLGNARSAGGFKWKYK